MEWIETDSCRRVTLTSWKEHLFIVVWLEPVKFLLFLFVCFFYLRMPVTRCRSTTCTKQQWSFWFGWGIVFKAKTPPPLNHRLQSHITTHSLSGNKVRDAHAGNTSVQSRTKSPLSFAANYLVRSKRGGRGFNPLAHTTENMPVGFCVLVFSSFSPMSFFVCLFEFKIKLWGLSCLQYAFLACRVKRRGRRFSQMDSLDFILTLFFVSVRDFFSKDLKSQKTCVSSQHCNEGF